MAGQMTYPEDTLASVASWSDPTPEPDTERYHRSEFARTTRHACGCIEHVQSYIEEYMGCDNDWFSPCIIHDDTMPSRNAIYALEASRKRDILTVAWNNAIEDAVREVVEWPNVTLSLWLLNPPF